MYNQICSHVLGASSRAKGFDRLNQETAVWPVQFLHPQMSIMVKYYQVHLLEEDKTLFLKQKNILVKMPSTEALDFGTIFLRL